MGPFVDQTAEGAYQWAHFTTLGAAFVVLCLLASAATVLFCAVALRRAEWDDKGAMLAVVMAIAGLASIFIWPYMFGGQLLNYTEDAIPTANSVALFSLASLGGSIVAFLAGGVMMNLSWLTFWRDSSQSGGAASSGGRPQVTQAMGSRPVGQPSSPQNLGSNATAVGGASPSAASPAQGTLIQGSPGGAPSPTPASGLGASGGGLGGSQQQGTLVQGSPGAAAPTPAPASQQGTLVDSAPANMAAPGASGNQTQVDGGGFGAAAGSPSGATMAPVGVQPTGTLLHLDVVAGPAIGASYNLEEGDNMIGRSPESSLFINDAAVSRAHAMIRVSDGEMSIVDLGSTSGTRVGDNPVEGRALGMGEIITVGQSSMTLLPMEGAAAGPAGGGQTMVGAPGGVSLALVVQSGPDTSKVFTLREGSNLVGREMGAEVQLSDQQVSRRHAVIVVRGDRVAVSDIGSTYGTTINGQKLAGTKLSIGDRVFVGQSELAITGPGV